jgi:hypothetical protein
MVLVESGEVKMPLFIIIYWLITIAEILVSMVISVPGWDIEV